MGVIFTLTQPTHFYYFFSWPCGRENFLHWISCSNFCTERIFIFLCSCNCTSIMSFCWKERFSNHKMMASFLLWEPDVSEHEILSGMRTSSSMLRILLLKSSRFEDTLWTFHMIIFWTSKQSVGLAWVGDEPCAIEVSKWEDCVRNGQSASRFEIVQAHHAGCCMGCEYHYCSSPNGQLIYKSGIFLWWCVTYFSVIWGFFFPSHWSSCTCLPTREQKVLWAFSELDLVAWLEMSFKW